MLPASNERQTVPYRHSGQYLSQYDCRCQRKKKSAYLRDFAHTLIRQARQLYAGEDFCVQLDQTVYALDATIIDLCLSVFPWAKFRQSKRAVKLHTLLDLRGTTPTFVSITDGKVHEVNILDRLVTEIGAIYIVDRGYLDFERLFASKPGTSIFIVRAKSNAQLNYAQCR